MSAPAAASTPTPWWLAYPDRLAAELDGLTAAGATWTERHPAAEADGDRSTPPAEDAPRLGAITLDVHWPHPAAQPGDPATLQLTVVLGPGFPWFPPSVHLPESPSNLRRHRNPINGALCLLADSGDWRPEMTAAELLTSQLPRLLAAGRDPGTTPDVLALEAGAEPAWTRMRLSLGALLVDDGALPPPGAPGGVAELVRVARGIGPVFALAALADGAQQTLWESRLLGAREITRIRWVRVRDLPADMDAGELWRRGAARLDNLPSGGDLTSTGDGSIEPNALAVLVPSEAAGRRPCEEWVLLTRGRQEEVPDPAGGDATAGPVADAQGGTHAPGEAGAEQLALFEPTELPAPPPADAAGAPGARVRVRRSYPIGRAALTARLPGNTEHLAHELVTVVGVGALGGPVALELARAGIGRLHLIDGDTHDPATAARQLPTLRDAGNPKALAVALRILDAHPQVHLTAGLRYLGADEGTELPTLIDSRLVIDCTANPAANRYTAAHLRLTGTPLLIAAATAGGWGGTLTTLPAASGGCWECLQLHRADRSVPWPPARPDGNIQPAGCSHPTFVGGWWDLGAVALQTARTALALLTTTNTDTDTVSRSPFGDLQVLTQYRRGRPVHPRWRSRPLTVHPACPLHQPAPTPGSRTQRPRAGHQEATWGVA